MLALIGNLDTTELVIVMLAAILVFGKRLPQVAAQAGKQLVKLRRSLDDAWRDTGMEREIREVQKNLEEAIPRDLSIGDMARIASAEMDKRIRANEELAHAERTVARGAAETGAEAGTGGGVQPEARPREGEGAETGAAPTKLVDF